MVRFWNTLSHNVPRKLGNTRRFTYEWHAKRIARHGSAYSHARWKIIDTLNLKVVGTLRERKLHDLVSKPSLWQPPSLSELSKRVFLVAQQVGKHSFQEYSLLLETAKIWTPPRSWRNFFHKSRPTISLEDRSLSFTSLKLAVWRFLSSRHLRNGCQRQTTEIPRNVPSLLKWRKENRTASFKSTDCKENKIMIDLITRQVFSNVFTRVWILTIVFLLRHTNSFLWNDNSAKVHLCVNIVRDNQQRVLRSWLHYHAFMSVFHEIIIDASNQRVNVAR